MENATPQTGQASPSPVRNIAIGIGIGIILSLLCLVLAGGGILASSLNLTADCKTRGPSLLDVFRIQTFAPGIFGRDQWTQSYAVSPERATMTWLSNDLNAVAHLEDLVYNCGYTRADMDEYFSDQNFKTAIFQNYQDVEKTAECSQNDLRHYEFTSNYAGDRYVMFYWVKPDGSNRLLDFMIAFPAKNEGLLREYAAKIFPELPACK